MSKDFEEKEFDERVDNALLDIAEQEDAEDRVRLEAAKMLKENKTGERQ